MDSQFTGTLFGVLVIHIGCFVVTLLSLGLTVPWALCFRHEWVAKHTIIDGRRLKFVGDGATLFTKFIIWYLLCIVTFGVYWFWTAINVNRWLAENTFLEDGIATIHIARIESWD